MSDGKWSGAGANRSWSRPGSRYVHDGLTPAQRRDLYESVADERFACDSCSGYHQLREHRECRAAEQARYLQARTGATAPARRKP